MLENKLKEVTGLGDKGSYVWQPIPPEWNAIAKKMIAEMEKVLNKHEKQNAEIWEIVQKYKKQIADEEADKLRRIGKRLL